MNFDDFDWAHALKTFGSVGPDDVSDALLGSQESKLLTTIMEKIVAPRFSKILDVSFNPYDIEVTRNAHKTISNLEDALDPSHPVLLVSSSISQIMGLVVWYGGTDCFRFPGYSSSFGGKVRCGNYNRVGIDAGFRFGPILEGKSTIICLLFEVSQSNVLGNG